MTTSLLRVRDVRTYKRQSIIGQSGCGLVASVSMGARQLKKRSNLRLVICSFLGLTALTQGISSASQANGDFVLLDGGTFTMGSNEHYREEAIERQVTVSPFQIKITEVTNAEFRAFVEATGYVTTAERDLDPSENPSLPKDLLRAGSMVFAQPPGKVDLTDFRVWWRYVPGADCATPRRPRQLN